MPSFSNQPEPSGSETQEHNELGSDQRQLRIATLIDELKGPDEDLRFSTSRALSDIGADAVPALIATLKDPNEDVRSEAAWALSVIGLMEHGLLERSDQREARTRPVLLHQADIERLGLRAEIRVTVVSGAPN